MSEEEILVCGGRNILVEGVLGKGGFSECVLGTDRESNMQCAFKLTFLDEEDANAKARQKQAMRAEIRVMNSLRKLKHPNLIHLYGYDLNTKFRGKPCICICMELCPRRELFDYLMYSGKFEEDLTRTVMEQICSGVKALHDLGFAHRDLKLPNIILDKSWICKLIDFGFTKSFMKRDLRTHCGTRGYMAPEVRDGNYKADKADVFAVGVIFFIVISGMPPFMDTVGSDWYWNKLVQPGKTEMFWRAHERKCQFSDSTKAFFEEMCHPDPEQRPTIDEVLANGWMTGNKKSTDEFKKLMHARQKDVDVERAKAQKVKDIIVDFIRSCVANLEDGELLKVQPYLENVYRSSFYNADKLEDVVAALKLLKGRGGKIAQIADEINDHWAENEKIEKSNELADAMQVKEVQTLTGLDAMKADLLLELMCSNDLNIEGYDHAETPQYIALDNLDLPPLPIDFKTTNTYKIRCGMGLVALCMSIWNERYDAEMEIDPDEGLIALQMKVIDKVELPVEGSDEFELVDQPFEMTMSLRMHRCQDSKYNQLTFENESVDMRAYKRFTQVVSDIVSSTSIGAVIVLE